MKTKSALQKFVIAAAAVMTLLGGCTCNKNESSSSTAGGAGEKKVFNYFRSSVHKSLDPMKQFDEASADIIDNVYDRLLQYDYLGRPYKLVPSLLEKMPEKQKDGVTFLFTLRKGVKFHDDAAFPDGKGREANIDDVIYSIKRFADANVNILSYSLIEGFVVGMDQFRAETEKLGKATDYSKLDIAGIKKINDHEMTVTFTRVNPLAFFPFAFSGMSIVPKEAVEKYGDEFQDHPVGTGPFYMKEYSRRGKMVLAKNPNYFGTYPTEGEPQDEANGFLKDAGKQLPLVDEVQLPLIEETQPAMLKFLKGEIDWIGIDKDHFEKMASVDEKGNFSLKPEYAEKFNMYTEAQLSTSMFGFNMQDKLMQNKALRQAIAYSLDAAEWIKLLRNGRGLTLKTIIPQPIAGSERDIAVEYYTKNIEMAKKKLAEAGYPNGQGLPEITIEFRSTTKLSRQDYEFVRAELAEAGIKLKANFQTFSAFLQKVENNNHQMIDFGWGADYPDAENFYALMYSKNKAPGPNHANFTNKRYDELYEKSRFMENGPERFKLFKEMSEILKEEVPVIYRMNPLGFGMYQKNVRNMKRNSMVGMPFKYLDIDPSQRKLSH